MADEIKTHSKHEIAMHERRRRETAGRDLHCHIPEVIHPRREGQRDFTDDLRPHVQCRVCVAPRVQRQWWPACSVVHSYT